LGLDKELAQAKGCHLQGRQKTDLVARAV